MIRVIAKALPLKMKRAAMATVLYGMLASMLALPIYAQPDPVDEYVVAKMAEKSIPGLVVAVIRDGHVVKQKAYGYANLELKVPATLDTSFILASTTKVFTATAIMQLVEQKKISLDQSVKQIVPSLPASWAKVTIRNCLAHTTGLPSATEDDINVTALAGDRDRLISMLAQKPVKEPGTETDYNATDYVLLAMVIESVSGLSYTDYIQHFILDPGGIKTASFGDAWSIIPERADLYTNVSMTADHTSLMVVDGKPVPSKKGILRFGHKDWPDYMMSVGGLNGTIRDLIALEAALASNKLIKAETLAEMESPQRLANGQDGDFGLGFATYPIAGPGTVSYGGGAAVWRVKIPSHKLTVIVLTNLQGCQPQSLTAGIAALYDGH